MAIKLGELLLREKIITSEQLEEGLKIQTLFGIKLGSSLVELGYISDEQLCRFLSRALGVPAVSSRALSAVSAEMLSLVSTELAGKYRVVPIRVEGKKLALAMSDPTDFKAIEEVAFASGYVVIPHIAPDVRLTAALSRYYRIWGDIRYLRLGGELETKRRAAPAPETVRNVEKIDMPIMSDSGELLSVEIPLEFEGFANLPGYDEEPFHAVDGVERYSVDRVSLEFASAKNRDQVAHVFIKYLGQEFTVGALFIIRQGHAIGWRGIASGKRLEEMEQISLLLSKPSVIRDVIETHRFSMGILIRTPENMHILKSLGVRPETPLLVLPIIMIKKVVAVVIVSAEMEALGKRLHELQKLVHKASLAFEMLIIKNKILMT
jgi:hypothetical protein